ncbi:MAG: ParM/StbA family protein, partial [Planctomycetota bacterium]
YKEWENRELFERRLREALCEFEVCGRRFSVELEQFLCRPEGSGLIWSRSRQQGMAFRHKKVVALMLGYRDASLALVDRGVTSGATVPLGMAWLLQRVRQRTAGQELASLAIAVHRAGTKIRPEKFASLTLSEDPENQSEESAEIAEAVRLARQEYWDAIARWLRESIPNELDEAIVAGGTADYLKSELKAYFGRVPLSWAAEVEEDVQRAFNLSDHNLCLRLADSYGAFRCLQRQVFPGPVEVGRVMGGKE